MVQQDTASKKQYRYVVIVLLLYCVSGTLLTLANKVAVVGFPYPTLLLALQNSMAVLFLLGAEAAIPSFPKIPRMNYPLFKAWTPLVLLFVAMLVSSLLSLLHVSASTVVVMRNLSTMIVALLEWFFLQTKVSGAAGVTMVGMLLGAILYGFNDLSFNSLGYFWLFINVSATSSYQVYVKKLIKDFSNETTDMSATSMSYYNNLLSLPCIVIICLFKGELSHATGMLSLGWRQTSLVLISGILGCSLSITAFMLNKAISATSMMVANNVNKFLIIAISEIFIQRALGPVAFIGTLLVLFFGWLYSQVRSKSISDLLSWFTKNTPLSLQTTTTTTTTTPTLTPNPNPNPITPSESEQPINRV